MMSKFKIILAIHHTDSHDILINNDRSATKRGGSLWRYNAPGNRRIGDM